MHGIVSQLGICGMSGVRTRLLNISRAKIFVFGLIVCLLVFVDEKFVWNVASAFFVPWLNLKGGSCWLFLRTESRFNGCSAYWVGRVLSIFSDAVSLLQTHS